MPGMTKQDSPLQITQGLSVAADDEDVVLNDIDLLLYLFRLPTPTIKGNASSIVASSELVLNLCCA